MKKRTELVQVILRTKKKEQLIHARRSESLIYTIREHDSFLMAVCAGKGICGKCKVRFLEGVVEPSKADEKFFTKKELEEGWRLACQAYPQKDCVIFMEEKEDEFFVLVDEENSDVHEKGRFRDLQEQNSSYGLAVDLGTTTIAMELVELSRGSIVDAYTAINQQCIYGIDVISRIEASNSGKRGELKRRILSDLERGILTLLKNRSGKIERMAISANTTMVHLLMGYSCEALGVYPFTPVNLHTIHITGRELFETGLPEIQEMEITMYPGISTYVGGDITAGLYALDFGKRETLSVLIDLGTNGEMAVGNHKRILVTSTAAGPAFEGGSIICGTGSVSGAICGLTIQGKRVLLKTIGSAKPMGICGTGAVEAAYEFLKEEIMDETGRMKEPWRKEGVLISEEGNIRVYQKDIREIQLAKSAVRAGMETLLLKYGITYDEVERIYIAGGFGCQMNIHKASRIGLFPMEWEKKIEAVGNTSLKGAVRYLLDPQAKEEIERLIQIVEEEPLSTSKEFQEFYMKYMCFGEEW